MTDIPQDQVEAVRQAVSHECGSCLCPRDRHYAKLCRPYNKDGPPCRCEEIAIAAIRAVSPLIAAVERERCAALVADFPWQLPLYKSREINEATDDAACSVVTQIVAALRGVPSSCAPSQNDGTVCDGRSVKGAVT